MKSLPHWTQLPRRLARWGTAACVVGLSAPAWGQLPSSQPSDETIGSHPSTSGDVVRREAPRDLAPVLYLAGPEELVLAAVDGVVPYGEGSGTTLVRTSATEIRLELHGRVRSTIDLTPLLAGDVRLGVRAGTIGAGALVALRHDGQLSPPTHLQPGGALDLPVDRLHDLGLLDGTAFLETYAPGQGRRRVGLLSTSSKLIIDQNL